jgi:hypothetical protein
MVVVLSQEQFKINLYGPVDTDFADMRRSLGRYSSLAD